MSILNKEDVIMTTKVDSLRGLTGVESARKVGNNTFEVVYEDGTRAIRLHRTNVVIFRPDGKFVINSDGWLTRTTKDRINKYCRTISVWQEKGEWYVGKVFDEKFKIISEFPIHYYDHMRFYSDGAYDGSATP
jgi:hypothetical protein